MEKAGFVLEWQRPKEVGIALSRRALRRGLRMFFLMLVVVAVIELVIYWGFCKLPLDETEMRFDFGGLLLFAFLSITGLCLLGFVLEPIFLRYRKVIYQLSKKGISKGVGLNRVLVAWAKIEDYSLTDDKTLPHFHTIKYRVLHQEGSLILPTRELADKVLEVFEERVEKKEHKNPIELSRWHVWFLLVLCVIYAAVLLYFHNIGLFLKAYSFLVLLLLGPGTIGMVCLAGFKRFSIRYVIDMALAFNFIGVLFWGISMIIVEYMTWYMLIISG